MEGISKVIKVLKAIAFVGAFIFVLYDEINGNEFSIMSIIGGLAIGAMAYVWVTIIEFLWYAGFNLLVSIIGSMIILFVLSFVLGFLPDTVFYILFIAAGIFFMIMDVNKFVPLRRRVQDEVPKNEVMNESQNVTQDNTENNI